MELVRLKTTVRKHFANLLIKKNEIGYGAESAVYSDGKFAYKKVKYSSYYVKWLLNLRKSDLIDNPCVPKIIAIYVDQYSRECLVKMELLKPLPDSIALKYWSIAEDIENGKYLRKKKLTKFEMVLKNITEFISGNDDVCVDLHSDNFMMRKRTIVITDPVY